MQGVQIYWRGEIPISKVVWQLSPHKEQFLSDSLERKRDEIWKIKVETYPDTYDGEILTLDDFHTSEDSISMQLGFMKFSRVLTLEEAGLRPQGYGTLGVQAILFSPDKKHILVGERSVDSMYCPLYHALPGGILEVTDSKGDFEAASLREIHEEVEVELNSEKEVVAILSELHGTVGVVVIITGTVTDVVDVSESVKGNEEWSDNELSWVPVDGLGQFSSDNSLEGLLFVKDEWESYQESGKSILW